METDTTFYWLSLAAIIISTLSGAFSIGLGVVEWRRHHRPLIVRCTVLNQKFHWWGDNSGTMFIIRVSMVNMASVGRTIFGTRYMQPEGYHVSDVFGEQKLGDSTVLYSTLGREHGGFAIPVDHLLQFPLDIHPHQSETRMLVMAVFPILLPDTSNIVRFPFVVLDVYENELARTDVPLGPYSSRGLEVLQELRPVE